MGRQILKKNSELRSVLEMATRLHTEF